MFGTFSQCANLRADRSPTNRDAFGAVMPAMKMRTEADAERNLVK